VRLTNIFILPCWTWHDENDWMLDWLLIGWRTFSSTNNYTWKVARERVRKKTRLRQWSAVVTRHWERLVLRGLWIGVRKINNELIIEIIPIRGGNCSENIWFSLWTCLESKVVVHIFPQRRAVLLHFLFEKNKPRNVSFLECSMLSFPFFSRYGR